MSSRGAGHRRFGQGAISKENCVGLRRAFGTYPSFVCWHETDLKSEVKGKVLWVSPTLEIKELKSPTWPT
jgi:hypothetical protein